MKINHNNRDISINYDICSNCYFKEINYFCAILPNPCWVDYHSFKANTRNSDIFNI